MKKSSTPSIAAMFLLFGLMVGMIVGGVGPASAQTTPNFGPNVYIMTPSMSSSAIQTQLTALSNEAQFSSNRYAVLFEPGTYSVESEVGYYESIAGLGETPSAVTINGYLTSNQTDSNGNLTTNFWRSIENMAINSPSTLQWGVSQGAAFRRMYVNGPLELTNTNCGEASGGFISDSQITGQVNPCSQQQWYSRNSSFGSWSGGVWNMVFSGVQGAPAQSFPNPPFTVVPTTPVSREKPFIYVDGSGNWNVFVPTVRTNSSGTSWASGGLGSGYSLAISTFFIAQPSNTVAQINAALAAGQNLILTPGIYKLTGSINITNPSTIVLGLGYANLVPQQGTSAITITDVNGVQIAGLLIDAGPVNSPVLLQVGSPTGTRASHQSNPTSINDVYFRIGGATAGSATTSLEVDSDNVILDNIWAWRADHGNGVGWTVNTAAHGLVVNGDNVTALGLAVEHYQQNQVVWNGNGGETIFYQSELPYDVPSQSAWMNGSANGYSSYSVSSSVASHVGYGLGVYSYFNQGVNIIEDSAITVPIAQGVTINDALSVFLAGSGQITHVVNNVGATASSANDGTPQTVVTYGGVACTTNCSVMPNPASNLAATAVSPTQINLSWTASTTAGVTYSVYRSTTSGFVASASNQIASGVSGTTYSDSGLTASSTYYYLVEANNSAGSSAATSQASTTTLPNSTVPNPATNLAATSISSSQINLTWTASTTTGVTYSVFRSTTTGFTPSSSNQIATGLSGTSYSDIGLTASTTYDYKVEASNSTGSSGATAQASGTTQPAGCTGSCSDVAAINSGGPSTGTFSADEDFSGGGAATTANTISTAGVTNAAPEAVYQSERAGVFTYTIPGLTAGGSYSVRLHFAEFYWTKAGQRIFNVSINGTAVLSNFDIIATAGSANKALVEQFTTTANSGGQIVVSFTAGSADQPKVSGIEVLGASAPPAEVTINAGGSATGTFVADEDFSGGGTAATGSAISITGVTNAAPEAVYQSERAGVFTYTIPGLVAGSTHTVRLHFAEFYWTAVGQRVFNVSINGAAILSNFDIIAAAGGADKALVEQFTETANSSGQIVVSFSTGSADQPKLSGLEVQ
jgi:hypothetical protein